MDIAAYTMSKKYTEKMVENMGGSGSTEGSSSGVGKSVAGIAQKVTAIHNPTTAYEGAEIFNDYSERTFSDDGAALTGNVATGRNSHAEGEATTASHTNTHAEGYGTIADQPQAHAEGYRTQATSSNAHAEGKNTIASSNQSHAEGIETTASGISSHAEGDSTTASGGRSHAEGYNTEATAHYSHAEGHSSTASGNCSHAEGSYTTASGLASHAEGQETVASSDVSHASGFYTLADNYGVTVSGKYNKGETNKDLTFSTNNGSALVIGNGSAEASRSNAFRVTYAGSVYGLASYNSSGADYAEYFEWLDGNTEAEDRVGYFVTLDGNKIRKAEPDEYILGVVSGNPCIIGNADEDWLHRWEHDEFGRFIKEEVEGFILDEEGNPTEEKYSGWRYKENPDYDNTQIYIERKDRPEWSAVGMMGVLAVRDDGTCQVNEYATVGAGGIATAGETYRVIERVSDCVVKIVLA